MKSPKGPTGPTGEAREESDPWMNTPLGQWTNRQIDKGMDRRTGGQTMRRWCPTQERLFSGIVASSPQQTPKTKPVW